MWVSWRTIRAVVLPGVGLAVLSGCVPLIGIETFPQVAIRRIHVADADTHEPIESAAIRYRLVEWHNWMTPVARSGHLADHRWPAYPNYPETAWAASALGQGTYVLSSTSRCTVHWLTVPTVLGCCLHETYLGIVEISATGYAGVWCTDSGRDDRRFRDCAREQEIEIGPRVTRVFLKRAVARESPADPKEIPDGVRYETRQDGGAER